MDYKMHLDPSDAMRQFIPTLTMGPACYSLSASDRHDKRSSFEEELPSGGKLRCRASSSAEAGKRTNEGPIQVDFDVDDTL